MFRAISVEEPLAEDAMMFEREIKLREKVDDIFARFDRDEDETLSIEEIMPYFIQELGLPYENIETIFYDMDSNNDNYISKEELYDFLLENRDIVEVPQITKRNSMPTTLREKAMKNLEKDFENLHFDTPLLRKAAQLEFK